jgi:hypothetical protein
LLISDLVNPGGVGADGVVGFPSLVASSGSTGELDLSHTRNSSSTSQTSAGYASQQSFGPVAAAATSASMTQVGASAAATASIPSVTSVAQHHLMHSQSLAAATAAGHSRQSSSGDSSSHGRNLSQGSSDTGIFGSMEKEKRRKAKLDEGRVDAELVINELMEGIELDKHNYEEDAESSGLQLYLAKDGTVTFDKSSNRDQELKPVVMTDLTR